MALVTTCGKCQDFVQLDETMLGQRLRCPRCHAVFTAGAATPFEELQKQLAPAGTSDRSQPRPWCDTTPIFSTGPRDEREPARPERRGRDSRGGRQMEPSRRVRAAELDPYRRPAALFVFVAGLPFGLPLLMLVLVPGGIVSGGVACGFGIPLAMLTILVGMLFILPRWPLARRAWLSLGTVAAAYALVLFVIVAQWIEFSSGSSAKGALAKGMKAKSMLIVSSGTSSGPQAGHLPGSDFKVEMPANARAQERHFTALTARDSFEAEEQQSHLTYRVEWADVQAPEVTGKSVEDYAGEDRTTFRLQDFEVSKEKIICFLDAKLASGFQAWDKLGNRLYVERVLLERRGTRWRVYFLCVSGPNDVSTTLEAGKFFESFKLDPVAR